MLRKHRLNGERGKKRLSMNRGRKCLNKNLKTIQIIINKRLYFQMKYAKFKQSKLSVTLNKHLR